MIYNPFTVPARSDLQDGQGRLTRPWLDWMGDVARKSGRSALWRGEYSKDLQYDVCDVVRDSEKLWIAKQANPVDGAAVTPGADDTVWELVISGGGTAHGIPPGGKEGDVLVKLSDKDYDVGWVHGGLNTHAEPLTDGAGSFITADGEMIYVTGVTG